MGIPRAAYKDTVYAGGNIPAGTEALLNIWALNRDPAIFTDPETFDHYRWLDPNNRAYLPGPRHYVYSFGLGARNCPASFLTYRILYLSLIRLLWAFHLQAEPGTIGQIVTQFMGRKTLRRWGSLSTSHPNTDDIVLCYKP